MRNWLWAHWVGVAEQEWGWGSLNRQHLVLELKWPVYSKDHTYLYLLDQSHTGNGISSFYSAVSSYCIKKRCNPDFCVILSEGTCSGGLVGFSETSSPPSIGCYRGGLLLFFLAASNQVVTFP